MGLSDYLEIESLLNTLFNKANYCNSINCSMMAGNEFIGCCTNDFFDEEDTLSLNDLLKLNTERIRIYGLPANNEQCGYHTKQGCKLKTHKGPLCLTHACHNLLRNLKQKEINYDPQITYFYLIGALNNLLKEDELINFKKYLKESATKLIN